MRTKKLTSHKQESYNLHDLEALFKKGDFVVFEQKAQRLLSREPRHGKCLHLLGLVYLQQSKNELAMDTLLKAKTALPNDPQVGDHLAIALARLGRMEEALSIHQHLIAQTVPSAVRLTNMGVILRMLGKLDEAEQCYQHAAELDPQSAVTRFNLANTIRDNGRYGDAIACYKKVLTLNSRYIEAYQNLGTLLKRTGHLQEAEGYLSEALTIEPANAELLNNLASAQIAQGRLGDAATTYRQALELVSDSALIYSNFLFCLAHQETISPEALYQAHLDYGAMIERQAIQYNHDSRVKAALGQPLKVGFVSGDLFDHPVATFLEPVLQELSKSSMEIFAYSNCEKEDDVSRKLRQYTRNWCRTSQLTDAAMAQQILADQIDILVDISGHTANNRLSVFAMKPAPVQASWIGYPGTTGMKAVDYYLSDGFFLPPGQFDSQFTEKIVQMPASVPFLPFEGAPPVNTLPALSNGYITFGSFNRQGKISRTVIALWSQLLRALPSSRMLLGAMPQDGENDLLINWFAQEGIARERLDFYKRSGMGCYLSLHQQVDICLDTFPYAGGTTTFHALWMGVPTLTLAGGTIPGRTGAGILGHAGLGTFVANNAADFVQKGLAWAGDLAALSDIRAGLRERFAQSAMSQPAVVAAGVERALRIMWQRWCAGLPAESFEVSLQDIDNITQENNK